MTQRWKLIIEYDGADFIGWQRQEEGLSVQGCIEDAIRAFCGEDVTLHAAGRTDAGVHAAGQVAHVDIARPSTEKEVRDATNAYLRPHRISVVEATPAPADFHARFSATKRIYCYRMLMGRFASPALSAGQVWHVYKDLDVAAMQAAAQRLTGTHDFSSFRAAECQAKSPVKTLDRLEVVEKPGGIERGRHVEIWAEARSFLHHQVRNMVGTLKLAGEGKWTAEDVSTALAARDRTRAGPMAPAAGLILVRVLYGS